MNTDKRLKNISLIFSCISSLIICVPLLPSILGSLFIMGFDPSLGLSMFIRFLRIIMLKLMPFIMVYFMSEKYKKHGTLLKFSATIWLIIYGTWMNLYLFNFGSFYIAVTYAVSTYTVATIWFIELKRSRYMNIKMLLKVLILIFSGLFGLFILPMLIFMFFLHIIISSPPDHLRTEIYLQRDIELLTTVAEYFADSDAGRTMFSRSGFDIVK